MYYVVEAHDVVLEGGAARRDHTLDVHVLAHLGREGGRGEEGREGSFEGEVRGIAWVSK